MLPFDSTRKRMSIILRHPITRERILFCKGADSAIFPRLKTALPGSEDEVILEKTQQHLNIYAKQGYIHTLNIVCIFLSCREICSRVLFMVRLGSNVKKREGIKKTLKISSRISDFYHGA